MYIEQGELSKAAKTVEEKLLLLNTEVHETLLSLMDIAIRISDMMMLDISQMLMNKQQKYSICGNITDI